MSRNLTQLFAVVFVFGFSVIADRPSNADAQALGVPSGTFLDVKLFVNTPEARNYDAGDAIKSSFKVKGTGGGNPSPNENYRFNWSWTLTSDNGSIPEVSGSGFFNVTGSNSSTVGTFTAGPTTIPSTNTPDWVKIELKLTVWHYSLLNEEYELDTIYNKAFYWHKDGTTLPPDVNLLD